MTTATVDLDIPVALYYNADMGTPFHRFYQLRWAVLKRDNFTCQYCGQYAPNVVLEVDHVVPLSEGGDNSMGNLVTACIACNRGKGGFRAETGPHSRLRLKPQNAPPKETLTSKVLKVRREEPNTSPREIAQRLGAKEGSVRQAINRHRGDSLP